MRTSLALALTIAACLTGSAFAQEKLAITPDLVAKAKEEGQVTVQYSAPLLAMQALVKDFNKAYPDITVNLERKAGSTGAQSLLQESAAGVHRVDVFDGTDASANADLVAHKAFVAVEPANVKDFPPSARAMAPYVYYPNKNLSVIMYNPKFVTEAEVEKLKQWTGVLDPEFKGKISLVEPSFGVTLAPLLYIVNNPKLGEDFLTKLKAQAPVIYLNTAQARDAVVSGQQPISWGAQWEAVSLSDVERGSPVRFIYPNPTVEFGADGWGILDQAPHPNAARLFFAWGLSRDGGLAFQGAQYNVRSALTNLDDTRSTVEKLKGQPWFQPPKETWSPDLNDWVKNAPKYQELWTKIMKGRN